MAKKSTGAKRADAVPSFLELEYRLAELPTSQHKAGLVGLVLLVRYIIAQERVASAAVEILHLDAGGVTLRFTEAGMVALFDEAYATERGEVESDKIWKNREKQEIPPLRMITEEVVDKGKVKTRTRYFYPKPIPRGAFLRDCDLSGEKLWLKLWRDMLWAIPRGVPATRTPYQDRAEGRAVNDGRDKFRELVQARERSVELASTYFLGAQAVTADGVAFEDTAARQLLLHFWPFATELFVPTLVDRDGTHFDPYVFVFPDVADLAAYCDEYFDYLRSRSVDARAYLPAAAVVDLPGEAGLRTMSWLSRLLQDRVQQGPAIALDSLLFAVDVIHARKDGNNVRIVSRQRVETALLTNEAYRRIERTKLYSSLVRGKLLQNVLETRPWFAGFNRMLATFPAAMTFEEGGFQHDARAMFEMTNPKLDGRNSTMADPGAEIPMLIYRIATRYLTGMLQDKYELTWNDETQRNPGKYNENKAKLAREALLAIRSRTGAAFRDYVATKIFAVGHGMSKEDFEAVANELLNHDERFRTLLMLALSAQMPRPPKPDANPQ